MKNTIDVNKCNPNYILFERENDLGVLKSFESVLKQRDLLGLEKQEKFKEKYEKYNNTFLKLSEALESVNKDIIEYDDCIFNIMTVDKSNGNKYLKQISTYYSNREDYKETNKYENQDEKER